MNILVLCGGLSTERNVSLSSGSLVSAALRRKGHRVLTLDVYRGYPETLPADPLSLFTVEQQPATAVSGVPDLDAVIASCGGRKEKVGPNVISLAKAADIVFFALHGDIGENGKLQATFDNFGVKYTGTGYQGSLIAMDKSLSKILLRAAGVTVPAGEVFPARKESIPEILRKVGLPCAVKPVSGGSSVGVSLVDDEPSLEKALLLAGKYEETVLVEKKITGRELTQGMLCGKVLPPVEIVPLTGFYDYENKYKAGATKEICPAPVGKEVLSRLAKTTEAVFSALRLGSYARVDYILGDDGVLYCLEANTLPGMTVTSLLPQEAAAVGIDYDTLCETIVLAVGRESGFPG